MSLSRWRWGALAQELQGEYIYYNTDGQPVDYWILIELPCANEHTYRGEGVRQSDRHDADERA
jgi:hypothetical protein